MSSNSNPSPWPIKRINPEEMREMFNDGQYWEKVQNGQWTAVILESRFSDALTEENVAITSVMVSYRDENEDEMARVHQYQRPDGSLAASGLPDPKRLFKDGVLYRLVKKIR
jgi:hypothetical protein